jgi:3',5'-cyclic AMP phosphodiesterase CpdA
MSENDTVRLAHFSDVHITAKPLGWNRRDFASKRLTGWMNVALLGRGYRFRHATAISRAFIDEVKGRKFDHLIFSGDATALGFEAEFARAAKELGVGKPGMPPGLAVPGNHDCYVRKPVKERLFERYFAPWQTGERVDGEVYPFAQKVGHVWLIGVNSSTYNFLTWDASGGVGALQRERLRKLLARLSPGPRILVTHYPFAVRSGKEEQRWHRLRDWRVTAKIAAEGGVKLWLHGHRHKPYLLTTHKEVPFPGICGGSVSQTGIWGYHDYTITGQDLSAVRRVYRPERKAFVDREEFTLKLA